jgi:hypothetical protein|tara:strand:- start:2438 stop:2605 length:168 start_codon:yes stop_codon:yes gene_type:complete
LRFDALESAVAGISFGHRAGAKLVGVKMAFACFDIDVQESDAYLPLFFVQGSVDD